MLRCNRPLNANVLLNSWKAISLGNSWRFDDDWEVPETTRLTKAHIQGLPLGQPAHCLGYARAMQGIGITETIEDLTAFFTASGTHADAAIQQRLTEGWVTANNTIQADSCIDPLTDLPTYEHFTRVLNELYASPGFDPDGLVIGRITLPTLPDGLTPRWTDLVELGLRCQEAFEGTGASLGYENNTITVLMQRTGENYARMTYCQAALTHNSHLPWDRADVTYESLTPTPEGVLSALAGTA